MQLTLVRGIFSRDMMTTGEMCISSMVTWQKKTAKAPVV